MKYKSYKTMSIRKGDGKGYHVEFKSGLSDKQSKEKYHLKHNDTNFKIIVEIVKDATNEDVRKAAGLCVKIGKSHKNNVIFNIPSFLKNKTQYLVEGALLSNFCFDAFKKCKNKSVQLYVKGNVDSNGFKKGTIYSNTQNLIRWMNEQPPNVMRPKDVVSLAKSYGKKYGWKIRVYRRKELENMGMGGILNVGKGSNNAEPTLLHIEYDNRKGVDKKGKHVALVGKGVMFDAGGISLKPSRGMEDMKYDKTGAMVVFGSLVAVSEMKYPLKITALMPLVENLPSGTAQRPSDIIRIHNGKTVEVLNTDAEGRLILADALSFAVEKKPDVIIDMATLTGAILVALGTCAIGAFGTDQKTINIIQKAGEETHDRIWQMPIWDDYGKLVESYIADIKNIGSDRGYAGSITAAMFLKFFVGDTPWVHLDIAGVMNYQIPMEYMERGARGAPVRLITETLGMMVKK